jgi:chemotaxis protein methyltransferase CheR
LDLLQDVYPYGPFDLIVCRNVLIYFLDDDRHRIIRELAQHLAGDGILFLGGTEVLLSPNEFGLQQIGPALYRRKPSGTS